MNPEDLEKLLKQVKSGSIEISQALETLKHFPSEFVPDACIDHHRTLRTGIPEVIFGESKTAEQMITIIRSMLARSGPVIATRVDPEKNSIIQAEISGLSYHEQARMLTCRPEPVDPEKVRGEIGVICAGTSDIPVAEEARITLESLGHLATPLYDAGVAGLHRLLSQKELLSNSSVIIVAAGMEGALPSVVGGLVSCPVIGVPTSIGYGAGIGGFAALLGMLNSCAPGMAVVNIDNGFGAACMAAAINRNNVD